MHQDILLIRPSLYAKYRGTLIIYIFHMNNYQKPYFVKSALHNTNKLKFNNLPNFAYSCYRMGGGEAPGGTGGGGGSAASHGGSHQDPFHFALSHRCLLLGSQGL